MTPRFGLIASRIFTLGLSAGAHAAFFLVPTRAQAPSVLTETSARIDVQVDAPEVIPTDDTVMNDRVTRPPTIARAHAATRARASRHDEAASSPLAATDAEPLHFVIAISSGAGGGTDSPSSAPIEPASLRASDDDAPLSSDAVDVAASLSRGEIPSYPPDARANGIEADVGLELVVAKDGSVETARGLRHVGYGLDEAALAAARKFRFTPAMKHGHTVRVRVRWTVEFRLQ